GSAAPKPRRFTARLRRSLVRDLAGMRRNLRTRKAQVLDARSRGRFAGTEPEPRAGLRAGHIPRSLNLPYDELYQKDGTLLPPDALRQKFEASGLDLDKPVVTSCGSGITASVLALGLYAIGRPDVAVYDGSWTEWGGDGDTPIETQEVPACRSSSPTTSRRSCAARTSRISRPSCPTARHRSRRSGWISTEISSSSAPARD